jgi:hypothetical protein
VHAARTIPTFFLQKWPSLTLEVPQELASAIAQNTQKRADQLGVKVKDAFFVFKKSWQI